MVAEVEDAIVSLEGRMAATLERIEEPLDHLEAVPNNSTLIPYEMVSAKWKLHIHNKI